MGVASSSLAPAGAEPIDRTVIVAKEAGRGKFAPANNGMWSWGDEIVVMYHDAASIFRRPSGQFIKDGHAKDATKPCYIFQARSIDGGLTWQEEKGPEGKGVIVQAGPPGNSPIDCFENGAAGWPWYGDDGPLPSDLPSAVDFGHPDFAFKVNFAGVNGLHSYWYYTTDRAQTWNGPYWFGGEGPLFGYYEISSRTDYIVNSPTDMMVFLSGQKIRPAGDDGGGPSAQQVFMVRTTDGGMTWGNPVEITTAFPPGEDSGCIMPSTVRLDAETLVTATRCVYNHRKEGGELDGAMELWRSTDNGASFSHLSTTSYHIHVGADRSTPPALIQIPDGRLVLTFGDRRARDGQDHPVSDSAFWGPGAGYGVSAYMSADGGETWTPDARKFPLRTDGATIDLGYTRNVLRSDGKLVTAYWMNIDYTDDRHIDATIWDPVAAFEEPPVEPDTSPPSLAVIEPADEATVGGTMRISVDASDDVGVSEVRLFVDGAADETTSDTSAPYVFELDTTTLTDGPHHFSVVAHDAAGNSKATSRSFTVANAPARVPGAPTAVSTTPGNGKATVAFSRPADDGGDPIASFTATCGSTSISRVASPIVVTGLTNGVTVNCTVYATNGVGSGPASAPPVPVTPATVPSAPNIMSVSPGDQRLTASYSPAPDRGSPITKYRATCRASGKGDRSAEDTSAPFGPITVTGMANATTYTCKVRAYNAMGAGVESAGVTGRVGAPTAPPVVDNVPGSATGSIKVTWTTATAPTNAPLTGHTVTCAASGSTKTTSVGNVRVFTQGGLVRTKTYVCRVAARNKHGTGPFQSAPVGTRPK
jgi:hypothetical protein